MTENGDFIKLSESSRNEDDAFANFQKKQSLLQTTTTFYSTPSISTSLNTSFLTHGNCFSLVESYDYGVLLLFSLVFLGFIGNGLVCVAIVVEKRLQNVTNYFLFSMAVSDLMVSAMVMPLNIMAQFHNGIWVSGFAVCTIHTSMDIFLCSVSIVHMSVISLDRYRGITAPFKARNRSKRAVALKIFLIWVVTCVVTAPMTVIGAVQPETIWSDCSCVPSPTINSVAAFQIFGTIVVFIIPSGIMVVTYVRTVVTLRKQLKLCTETAAKTGDSKLRRHRKPTVKKNSKDQIGNVTTADHQVSQARVTEDSDTQPLFGLAAANDAIFKALQAKGRAVKDKPENKRYTLRGLKHRHKNYVEDNPKADDIETKKQNNDSDGDGDYDNKRNMETINKDVCTNNYGNNNNNNNKNKNINKVKRNDSYQFGCNSDMNNIDISPGSSTPTESSSNMNKSNSLHDNISVIGHDTRRRRSNTFDNSTRLLEVTLSVPTTKPVNCKVVQPSNSAADSSSSFGRRSKLRQSIRQVMPQAHLLAPPQIKLPPIKSRPKSMKEIMRRAATVHYFQSRRGTAQTVAREAKATKVLGIVFLSFFCCWSPFFVSNMTIAFCGSVCEEGLPDQAAIVFLWLGYVSSILNPIIYTTFNNTFRQSFKDIIMCRCLRRTVSRQSTAPVAYRGTASRRVPNIGMEASVISAGNSSVPNSQQAQEITPL